MNTHCEDDDVYENESLVRMFRRDADTDARTNARALSDRQLIPWVHHDMRHFMARENMCVRTAERFLMDERFRQYSHHAVEPKLLEKVYEVNKAFKGHFEVVKTQKLYVSFCC